MAASIVKELYARLFLATDDEAGPAFEDALGLDLSAWLVVHAWIMLAYGEWLRRHRRQIESRAPLRAARDAFDALGMNPWAERARQELRAAGESSQQRERDSLDELTPQELQIVQMVAQGLSNRVIAERLSTSLRAGLRAGTGSQPMTIPVPAAETITQTLACSRTILRGPELRKIRLDHPDLQSLAPDEDTSADGISLVSCPGLRCGC
ncbi:MAG: LuxR C-terminal-related transcriptional regulator [Streptosporangiaceae bacterium]